MKKILYLSVLVAAVLCVSPSSQAGVSRGGERNTNQGVDALHNNTTGSDNSAFGYQALSSNIDGTYNTATGGTALQFNTSGTRNTATGFQALVSNTDGIRNTATGFGALTLNTSGNRNTATGYSALFNNTTGRNNTASGYIALLFNTTGILNTADGFLALFNNSTGSGNTVLGAFAGDNLTTGDNNIEIGNEGVADEANTIRIGDPNVQTNTFVAGIFNAATSGGIPVFVDASGHLGTIPSSQRFKDGIKPMNNKSEAILSLRPVTFRYKKEIDSKTTPQFGLVAEEVAKVDPDLVARDSKGEIYSVRYEAVNAMLLNEFIKEHRQVQEQQKQIDKLTAQFKEQASMLQKVSAQIELMKAAPRTVADRN